MGLHHLLPDFSLKVLLFWLLLTLGCCFWIAIALTVAVVFILCYYRIPAPAASVAHPAAAYVVAHRGAGFDAPENTIAALKLAKENGAVAVEFDVDYTSDGMAVVFHDDTVDRCTDGSGKLCEMTLASVKKLNASAHHPNGDRFPNERIPTLDEVIEFCLANNLLMYIDVKSNVKLSTDVLVGLFRRYPALYKKAIVCSFNPLIVYSVRSKDPDIVGGLIYRNNLLTRFFDETDRDIGWYLKLASPLIDIFLHWSHYCWLWFLCGNSVFLANVGDVSESTVEYFGKRGVRVVVWTVNRQHDRYYFLKSLRCPIITDTMSDAGCEVEKI